MKKPGFIFCAIIVSSPMIAQKVGIGTNAPQAGLHLISNDGFLALGTLNIGAVLPALGSGSHLIWYPRKAAFRAGYISGGNSAWDDAQIGQYSFATTANSQASGTGSTAMGALSVASGSESVAIGTQTLASGQSAFAIGETSRATTDLAMSFGRRAYANAVASVAIGYNVNAGYTPTAGVNAIAFGVGETMQFTVGGHYATGSRAFAIGNNCRAVGNRAFAIGNDNAAGADFFGAELGRYSFALGNSCNASGIFSFAFGNNANTNGKTGSMVLGSRVDGVSINALADHQLLAQFPGGYRFETNTAPSLGVYLLPNGTAWNSFCDSTKKEDALLMDDEVMLQKLSDIDYYSWKYKDDPDPQNRHYGIMAQDFFAAFGKDALGIIGNDTLVNPIDMLGVAFSAIKALEKRTARLEELEKENAMLKKALGKRRR